MNLTIFTAWQLVNFEGLWGSTWYSVMRVLKQRVMRLLLLIFDLSDPAAPVTAAARYLSRRLLWFPMSKSLQTRHYFKLHRIYSHTQKQENLQCEAQQKYPPAWIGTLWLVVEVNRIICGRLTAEKMILAFSQFSCPWLCPLNFQGKKCNGVIWVAVEHLIFT